MLLSLYIVSPAYALSIVNGSAIVGTGEVRDGMTLVHFEGNLYNAQNLRRYDERVAQAAGRLVQKYPTIAQVLIKPEHLVQVGTYDTESLRLDITKPEALEAWAGEKVESGLTQAGQDKLLQGQLKEHMRRGLPISFESFRRP